MRKHPAATNDYEKGRLAPTNERPFVACLHGLSEDGCHMVKKQVARCDIAMHSCVCVRHDSRASKVCAAIGANVQVSLVLDLIQVVLRLCASGLGLP